VSSKDNRSTLAMLEPLGQPSETLFERLTAAGIHVAHRRGRIRISPHVYNTTGDIDRALDVLVDSRSPSRYPRAEPHTPRSWTRTARRSGRI
jgi:selenocysteine lyase/cysteine desulfurase